MVRCPSNTAIVLLFVHRASLAEYPCQHQSTHLCICICLSVSTYMRKKHYFFRSICLRIAWDCPSDIGDVPSLAAGRFGQLPCLFCNSGTGIADENQLRISSVHTLDSPQDIDFDWWCRFPEKNKVPDFATLSSLLRNATKHEIPAAWSRILGAIRDAHPEVRSLQPLGESVFGGQTPHPNIPQPDCPAKTHTYVAIRMLRGGSKGV